MRFVAVLFVLCVVCLGQAQDSTSITNDSASALLKALSVADSTLMAAEEALSTAIDSTERACQISLQRALVSLYTAQEAYLTYTGDRIGAWRAKREKEQALGKMYHLLPATEFKVELKKLRLDTDG